MGYRQSASWPIDILVCKGYLRRIKGEYGHASLSRFTPQ